VHSVLFDLYGTLIDISTDEQDIAVHKTTARFLSYIGVRIDAETLRSALLGSIEAALKESREAHPEVDITEVFGEITRRFGNGVRDRAPAVHAAALFRALSVRRLSLFPGVADALSRICGRYPCACVTNAQWAFAGPEMSVLGLDGLFRTVVMSSRMGFGKPDPRMFWAALAELGAEAGASVYIGDTPASDLVGAAAAGMRCIIFETEGREYGALRPDATFRDYRELPDLIERMALTK
jgi:putative hydrolase of the HAD superfamily